MTTSATTGVERIAEAFARAHADGRRAALMPYMMGGFPDLETSGAIGRAYVEGGADLIELGADKPLITEEIFANKRFAATKLLGLALERAVLQDDGRYCWTYVDEAMLREAHADGEDTEEIVQHLRAVEGVEAAALFKDYEGAVRVSLRSSGRINVQAAAATLGGGGHFMASGLTFEGDLKGAIEAVHRALRAQGL